MIVGRLFVIVSMFFLLCHTWFHPPAVSSIPNEREMDMMWYYSSMNWFIDEQQLSILSCPAVFMQPVIEVLYCSLSCVCAVQTAFGFHIFDFNC